MIQETMQKESVSKKKAAPHCHDCEELLHPDHKKVLPKLNRVVGQIHGIQKMIQEQRYCVDILIQMRAAMSALRNVEMEIFETHLQSCLQDALKSTNKKEAEKKISELSDLLRKRSVI